MKDHSIHALLYAFGGSLFLFLLHHLPVNQIFIDPFSEAIKNHDIMDIAFSKFRNHNDPALFDPRIVIINSKVTNREQIANTIDYLNRNEVAVIGVDLLFDTVYHTAQDTLLREVLESTKQLVLGNTFSETQNHFESVSEFQSDSFFSKGKLQAYVNLGTNDGYSVRAFEPYHIINGIETKSFAMQVASMYNPDINKLTHLKAHTKEWINFKRLQPGVQNMRAPFNSKQAVHYVMHQMDRFLEDTSQFDNNYFKDKIVLIGFCGENDNSLSMNDRYFTPLNEQYTGRSLPDMHGVVIHANIISMILDQDFIMDIPGSIIFILSVLIFFINYFVFKKMSPKDYFRSIPYIRFIQIIEFFTLLGICLSLLLFANIKLGFIFLTTTIIISYELYELYEHKLKQYPEAYLQIIRDWFERNSFTKKA
ncbi:MAG: CHASE2 domain-containing protein [Saprospiraceae bacterium]